MAAAGTYGNPADRYCWKTCPACGRCSNNGMRSICGRECSGRYDPTGIVDPHPQDYCQCSQGVLRWRTKTGKMAVSEYKTNPFKGEVMMREKTEDERDWEAYLQDMREKYHDENWDPISYS